MTVGDASKNTAELQLEALPFWLDTTRMEEVFSPGARLPAPGLKLTVSPDALNSVYQAVEPAGTRAVKLKVTTKGASGCDDAVTTAAPAPPVAAHPPTRPTSTTGEDRRSNACGCAHVAFQATGNFASTVAGKNEQRARQLAATRQRARRTLGHAVAERGGGPGVVAKDADHCETKKSESVRASCGATEPRCALLGTSHFSAYIMKSMSS